MTALIRMARRRQAKACGIPLRFQGGVVARETRTARSLLIRAAGVVFKGPRSAPYFVEVTNRFLLLRPIGLALRARLRREGGFATLFDGAASPPWEGDLCKTEISTVGAVIDRAYRDVSSSYAKVSLGGRGMIFETTVKTIWQQPLAPVATLCRRSAAS
jgi:hypothetical protein